MPLRIDCEPRVGTGRNARAIRDQEGNAVVERRWLLGPAEGLIWVVMFGFAVGGILFLIARPYWGGGWNNSAAPQVIEQVIEKPAAPAPVVQPPDPPVREPDRPRSVWSNPANQ